MKFFKQGDIIRLKDDIRCWVVLQVTSEDIAKGIFADKPGLYGFGGMWYGNHPARKHSYGKIILLPRNKGNLFIVGTIYKSPYKQLLKWVS